jgi:nucleoside-diphosphate-sugar epimerase
VGFRKLTSVAYDVRDLPDADTLANTSNPRLAYLYSKVLAHVSATEFVEKNKVHFDLVRVLPGYVQGANELYRSAEEMRDQAILGSNEGTINTALGRSGGDGRPTGQVFLDDIAKAHVLALKAEGVKNLTNLLIIGNGGEATLWEDVVPVIKKLFPDAVAKGVLKPAMKDKSPAPKFDVASSEEALGFKFAGPEEYVKSVVGQYVDFVGA